MTYLGIDPGKLGCVAALTDSLVEYQALGSSRAVVSFLVKHSRCELACIEEQQPRPTYWKGRSSILKSTCQLYGNYWYLIGLLEGLGIPYERLLPRQWQKRFGIEKESVEGSKGQREHAWKKQLQSKARHLFPSQKVTLRNCDALLLAECARRLMEGAM